MSPIPIILAKACILLASLAQLPLAHAQRPPLTSITVAVPPTFNVGALLLAQSKGIFKKHGLDATIKIVTSEKTMMTGVLNNSYDFGYGNVVSNLQAIDKKLPIMLVHPAYGYPHDEAEDPHRIYVSANSRITDPTQLAHAKIGTPYIKNIAEWTTKKVLENMGITDHTKIQWVFVTEKDAVAKINSGKIDAVWLKQPAGSAALKEGLKTLIAVSANAMPGAVGGYYFTSKRFTVKHWDLLARFQSALTEANLYATHNPTQNREALIAHFGFDRDIVYAAHLNKHPNDRGLALLQNIAKDLVRYKLITTEPDVNIIFWNK